MKKIALVNQRYGLEVNGGSEYYTRQLAEHLKNDYDVTVLTTKAIGYDTWENYYTADEEVINGVKVKRFDVERKRNTFGMKALFRLQKYLPFGKKMLQKMWIKAQGPYAPALIRYMQEHEKEYDVFLFVTYLYYPTVFGIKAVSDKAIMIPTAHDEPYIYFDIFQDIFEKTKAFVYLTPEEKRFVESKFPVEVKPNVVTGSGVDLPREISGDAFRSKYQVTGDYVVYVGRVDPNKGCGEMFEAFETYKQQSGDANLQLVVLGKAEMDIPEREDILYLGFVSEQDKFNCIAGSIALWLPSRFESLSIAVLEAFAMGIPVLVNGNCEVLKGHCERSGAGIFYCNEEEAVSGLKRIYQESDRDEIRQNALRYMKENYAWEIIRNKTVDLISSI